jgi:hypothetical protein
MQGLRCTKISQITLIVVCFATILNAQIKYITPASFEWMFRTSIDIMNTYRYYNLIIHVHDPTFLFDANTIQTGANNYFIPTSFGPMTVGPIQLNMLIYGKWQVNESLGLGFFAIANGIDLQISDKEHPELRDPDGPYGDLYA